MAELFLLFPYIVLPVAIAFFVVGADLRTIVKSYAIWIGGILLLAVPAGTRFGEILGWGLILAMFFTVLAIPFISYQLKHWKWPDPGVLRRRLQANAAPSDGPILVSQTPAHCSTVPSVASTKVRQTVVRRGSFF